MHDHKKRLNAGDSLLVDVINLVPINGMSGDIQYAWKFGFTNENIKEHWLELNPFDSLGFTIKASGANTPPMQKTFELYSSNEIEIGFNIREVDDGYLT